MSSARKTLITEADVVGASKRGAKAISIDSNTIVTPLAGETARRLGILLSTEVLPPSVGVQAVEILQPADKRNPRAETVVALGADHGGYQLKEQLKKALTGWGYSVADVGTNSEQPCDYPDFAYAVARMVASGEAARGVMIDGVGVASAIVANKVPGVRAAAATDEFMARSSREHNDANVLTLGGRVLGVEAAKSILNVWLETWFGGGRHQARLKKITEIEERYSRKR